MKSYQGKRCFCRLVIFCVCSEIGDENKGRQMLEKMGWKRGEGLGKDGAGIKDPVILISPCFVYTVSCVLEREIYSRFPLCVRRRFSCMCARLSPGWVLELPRR